MQHARLQHAARAAGKAATGGAVGAAGACGAPPTYIIKPSAGSEGAGIVLTQHEARLPQLRRAVAQAYLPPMLYDGKKFDLRFYVVIRTMPRRAADDVCLLIASQLPPNCLLIAS